MICRKQTVVVGLLCQQACLLLAEAFQRMRRKLAYETDANLKILQSTNLDKSWSFHSSQQAPLICLCIWSCDKKHSGLHRPQHQHKAQKEKINGPWKKWFNRRILCPLLLNDRFVARQLPHRHPGANLQQDQPKKDMTCSNLVSSSIPVSSKAERKRICKFAS